MINKISVRENKDSLQPMGKKCPNVNKNISKKWPVLMHCVGVFLLHFYLCKMRDKGYFCSLNITNKNLKR